MLRRFTDLHSLMLFVLAFGLFLRVWHYAMNYTIWFDESVLLENVLSKNFHELLGSLQYDTAAPPLFVWLLKSLSILFGNDPYIFRLFPFVSSILTLLLTVPLARKVLSPSAAVLVVALVAVSDHHIWLGCVVKPYAIDALISTILLLYYVSTDHWSASRRLFGFAAMIPPMLCFSYPAVFMIGGLLLAMLPVAYRSGSRGWFAWCVASGVSAATFAALYFGPIQAQKVSTLVDWWSRNYPNFANPASIPGWFVMRTFSVFQFACQPSGLFLIFLAPFGLRAFWREGRRGLVVSIATMFVGVWIAAAMKSYPYGHSRLMLFAAPGVLLMCAKGMELLFQRWRHTPSLAVLLVCITFGPSAWHLARPWPKPDARSVQEYVTQHRQPGDVVMSDELNYLYFFHGELKPLSEAKDLSNTRRIWAVMDFHTDEMRRGYIEVYLRPLGFELVEATQFHWAAAYLYERRP